MIPQSCKHKTTKTLFKKPWKKSRKKIIVNFTQTESKHLKKYLHLVLWHEFVRNLSRSLTAAKTYWMLLDHRSSLRRSVVNNRKIFRPSFRFKISFCRNSSIYFREDSCIAHCVVKLYLIYFLFILLGTI